MWKFSLLLFLQLGLKCHSQSIKVECDIVIAGGSLSATAAAITAANVSRYNSPKTRTCLLEPTDWPGGQLTASNVPPDFGDENKQSSNLPSSLVQILTKASGSWEANPGACWVSTKCTNAEIITFVVQDLLASLSPELTVYYNTVVTSTSRDPAGNVVSIEAVQREPSEGSTGWEHLLSEDLADWYSPEDGPSFRKRRLSFAGFAVVVEASEFADVLMTGLDPTEVAQGMETPMEDSTDLVTDCGQSFVFPFYMRYEIEKVPEEELAKIPTGSCGSVACDLQGLTWTQVWSYRRSLAVGDDADMYTFAQGEISNQNLDNDYPSGYLFMGLQEALQSAHGAGGRWEGGINVTSLANAEQRAYGWFQYMKQQAPLEVQPFLDLGRAHTGTAHGLAKMPYLRESRRSRAGLGGFKLSYADLNYSNPEDMGATARHFEDTVAIGVYLYGDVHRLADGVCTGSSAYPDYVYSTHPVKPYYIPFRALTVATAPNLLVAGKSMAQTFMANAATRLHPIDYGSGVAAGAAAVLMVTESLSTVGLYAKVSVLQDLLKSETVGSPLTWTLPPKTEKQRQHAPPSSPVSPVSPLVSSLMRAVWLPIQYKCVTQQDVSKTINGLKAQGVTRVYVDVWNNGVTYFNSSTMRELVGPAGLGQDVLQWTLDAATPLGIEVVAWFEYGLMASYTSTFDSNNFAKIAAAKGWILGVADNFHWMDGRIADVQAFVVGIIKDAQTEYGSKGLLGVQWDDHFSFPQSLGGSVSVMTGIARTVRDAFKVAHADALYSLSPATLDVALNTYNVDWAAWAENDYVDEVVPQIYRSAFSAFKTEFDHTMATLSTKGKDKWTAAGVRCDGSGSPTPWADVQQMLSYSSSRGIGASVWYAHGVLELYPAEFNKEWGTGFVTHTKE